MTTANETYDVFVSYGKSGIPGPSPDAQHKSRRNITGIAVAVDMLGAMLLPQQRQRH
jgi:hypothetical protein